MTCRLNIVQVTKKEGALKACVGTRFQCQRAFAVYLQRSLKESICLFSHDINVSRGVDFKKLSSREVSRSFRLNGPLIGRPIAFMLSVQLSCVGTCIRLCVWGKDSGTSQAHAKSGDINSPSDSA